MTKATQPNLSFGNQSDRLTDTTRTMKTGLKFTMKSIREKGQAAI